jgi:hypothetical protein
MQDPGFKSETGYLTQPFFEQMCPQFKHSEIILPTKAAETRYY